MNARIGSMLAVLALLLSAGASWAGSENRLGTGGASELRLPVGPRSIGMAAANAGMVQGAEAIFYNPAGLSATDRKTELMFAYTKQIGDMDLNYFALAQSLGGFGNLGFSAKVLSIGDIPLTTEAAPDGTGEIFSPTYATLGITYAKQMTDRVYFGGTLNYVDETVLQTSSKTIAFDFGFQYETGFHSMRLGAVMKNVGPATNFSGADFDRNQQLDGDDPQAAPHTVSLGSADYELPSIFVGSASYPMMQGTNNLTLHALYQNNSFDVDEWRFGAEYMYRKDFALRAGYKYSSNDDNLFGFSYGLGFRVPFGASSLSVDYAGQAVSNYFDDVQHFGVTLAF